MFEWDAEETPRDMTRKKQAWTEEEITNQVVDIEQFEWVKEITSQSENESKLMAQAFLSK